MATKIPRVWFKSISLENVRSFGTKQTINFTDKNGNAARWNVILGDNGTGKTTVLKGLCILSGRASDSYIISMMRNGMTPIMSGTAKRQDENLNLISNIHIQAHRHGGPFVFSSSLFVNWSTLGEEFVIHAYGAIRRTGSYGSEQSQISTVANLFDENIQLLSAESWLLEAELDSLKEVNNRYELVKIALKRLFIGEIKEIKSKKYYVSTQVFFETNYGDVMMNELSLGYKTLAAWIVDFSKGLFGRYPDSENPLAEPAVCLVDEIDLHLHPKFQRNIIQFLTDTFPNTQFIVTAHSPLIVQSAEDANIILLKREGDETHVADGIDVHSWRIDQILSSDLFGGIGGRAPQIEEKMTRRRALLRKDERTHEEQQELDELEKELGELPVMETREALKAIDIISKAVISEG